MKHFIYMSSLHTAYTSKDIETAVFWDVAPCRSRDNQHLEECVTSIFRLLANC
jgi:hypothetical protein